MIGVGIHGVGVMDAIMGVSVKVGAGDGVKVDVAVSLGGTGVSDGGSGAGGNVAVIGGGRINGVGE